MRVVRGIALLGVGVLLTAGLSVAGGAAAAADPPSTIHVAQSCGGVQDGSETKPYCTIGQAIAFAVPGQTIAVREGTYFGTEVPRSGEAGKPITLAARPSSLGTAVTIIGEPAFRFSGVHDVVVDGFITNTGGPGVVVENSSDVTFTNGRISAVSGPGVEIKGDSRRVTVSATLANVTRGPAFAVGGGATDTLLAANSIRGIRYTGVPPYPAVAVAGAPRTTIINNTIVTDCLTGVDVSGDSAGFALVNSIVRTTTVSTPGRCAGSPAPDPASVLPVAVTGAATSDGQIDYNVIDPGHGGALYSWAGMTFPDPSALHAATGQAAHDLRADPKLGAVADTSFGLRPGSPAIDSAKATAPRLPAIDLRGNAHADNPDAGNSGGGYVDRGAIEIVPTPTVTTTIVHAPGGGALDAVVTSSRTYPWPTDGPIGTFSFRGDGPASVINRTGTARLTFGNAGAACATTMLSLDGFRSTSLAYSDAPCVMLGGGYAAVTPQRVLDTRSAIGRPGTTPLSGGQQVDFAIPGAAATASAVVLNVTVTQPQSSGSLRVMRSDLFEPVGANLHFVANQTIANLVTVPVRNGKVSIYNDSPGTSHVLADLVGYYANTPNGLTAATPARVLDTRSAIGVPGTSPVGPQGRVVVDVSSRVPAGTTAVVLNLTVTQSTQSGHITLFPNGSAVPTASNLNFVAGQTVNNMAIAPVVEGKIAFAHGGSGTVHVIADLAGWFAPGAGSTLLPTYRSHLFEPGQNAGGLIGPGQSVRIFVNKTWCGSSACEPRKAVVANLTVDTAGAAGYLSIYPYGQPKPVVSVLNFTKGQTVSTQATVGVAEDSFMVFNSSSATVEVFVDQFGLYFGSMA
ncbi:right-handed parallel beta-helix repeat-containing protein [Asanoa sp. NPDC049518]|uniref:right-handed parallel beta-helix repeat-containing protein n=1 Tax=unclassified Asanoa TaxID=2685164 RepID=UPI003413EB5C